MSPDLPVSEWLIHTKIAWITYEAELASVGIDKFRLQERLPLWKELHLWLQQSTCGRQLFVFKLASQLTSCCIQVIEKNRLRLCKNPIV